MASWPQTIARTVQNYLFAPQIEQKSSATSGLIAFHQLGQPQWTPRNYESFAREAFSQNAIAYRSVRMIAEAASSVPFRIQVEGGELTEHPLLSLLSCPNPHQCGPELMENWYGFLLVAGNAYMEAVRVSSSPRELYVLRPDRMKIIPGANGWPEAYQYSVGGQSHNFVFNSDDKVKPILHQTLFHPTNDHYGMSPIEAAATAVDIHNSASQWNKALLDNSARPSGALIYNAKDGNMTKEQFERLKSELEMSYEGARNAGRPLLLEGGLDWKSMGLTPKDMDFIEAKYVAAREIALALGVPPMLLGIPGDNTYSNYVEANRSFWRQTVIPLVEKTAKAFTNWLGGAFEENLSLKADLDRVVALQSERSELWERTMKASFLTLNERRQMLGFPPLEGGDEISSEQM